jgi:high-affinity K+ transport system ATPase subunit B
MRDGGNGATFRISVLPSVLLLRDPVRSLLPNISVLFVVLCSLFLLLFVVVVTVHSFTVHCSCYYSFATLTEVFPCFSPSCEANARV